MKNLFLLLFAFLLPWFLFAAPVPYAVKVAINGVNFQSDVKFSFALRDANGTVYWRNGDDANASIDVPDDLGLYGVFIGGQGIHPFLGANKLLAYFRMTNWLTVSSIELFLAKIQLVVGFLQKSSTTKPTEISRMMTI